jgi:hypothetical protein
VREGKYNLLYLYINIELGYDLNYPYENSDEEEKM